jgi:peptidoglycan/LPS O-acetylase OafA/YrhL
MDVTGKVPGGVIGLIFGWPDIWSRIGPSFLLGMIAYAYRTHLRRSWVVVLALWSGAVVTCWVSQHIGDMLVAPALAYTVFMVGFSDRLKLHDAAKYGDFSYGTYLYAFPIQQILHATTNLSLPAFIITSMVLSLLAGVMSWKLVEKRFMPRRRRREAYEPGRAASVGDAAFAAKPQN